MRGSVTQAYRILLLGDEKYGFRCRRVPFILTSFCPTPTGDENVRKCRLNVSCRTLGRRRSAEVSLKRAALHPRATKMLGSVTQACRAVPSGDENVRKCCLSVPRYILGQRKVWVSLPRSPLHPYVILPYTHGQQKWTEVSPERVVLYPRATKKRESVTQECRAALSGDEKYGFRCRRVPLILTSFCLAPLGNEKARKCRLNVSYCTLGRRKCATVLPKRVVPHSRATKKC